jgi:hypothetical protein
MVSLTDTLPEMKECINCKRVMKADEAFGPCRSHEDGRQTYCVLCRQNKAPAKPKLDKDDVCFLTTHFKTCGSCKRTKPLEEFAFPRTQRLLDADERDYYDTCKTCSTLFYVGKHGTRTPRCIDPGKEQTSKLKANAKWVQVDDLTHACGLGVIQETEAGFVATRYADNSSRTFQVNAEARQWVKEATRAP